MPSVFDRTYRHGLQAHVHNLLYDENVDAKPKERLGQYDTEAARQGKSKSKVGMMGRSKMIRADVREWAKHYDGPLYHSLLADLPYGINVGNQKWDNGEAVFDPETWKLIMRTLLPGAFCLAYTGDVNDDLISVAIREAGFIMHHKVFAWVKAEGMPKQNKIEHPAFKGYRYGAQSLKPAVEPLRLFQKPYDGKARESIVKHGAGALNIDGARLDSTSQTFPKTRRARIFGAGRSQRAVQIPAGGRYPANVALDEASARLLDKMSGTSRSPRENKKHTQRVKPGASGTMSGGWYGEREIQGYADEGGASRFFFVVQAQLKDADPVYYAPKVKAAEKRAAAERNAHLTLKPLALNQYFATLLLPPKEYAPRRLLVPFAGVASEVIGALWAGWEEVVGVEREKDYVLIGEERVKFWQAKAPGAKARTRRDAPADRLFE